MYDLTIVGGGPAGATLARMLGKKYKILLLEKRNYEIEYNSANDKCCGGLIAPDAQLMLAKFALGIPSSVLLSPQLFAVRTIDIDNSIERYYQRHYININREKFDKWLISIIPSEVNLMFNCIYKSFEVKENVVIVKFNKDGADYEEKTRLLIGADGAFSRVRRQGFENYPMSKLYIAIQEWFETKQNADYYGAIFDSEITDFYSWTIPKENYLILGSALEINNSPRKKFELLKQRLSNYGFELTNCIKRNGAHIQRPISEKQICIGNERIGLIGEAAGFISPSSAEGLSYAFRSALALSKALNNGIEGYIKYYNEYTKSLKHNVIIKNLKSPAMYNKKLRKAAMKSGLMSVKMENMI